MGRGGAQIVAFTGIQKIYQILQCLCSKYECPVVTDLFIRHGDEGLCQFKQSVLFFELKVLFFGNIRRAPHEGLLHHALFFNDIVTFNNITGLDIVIIFKGHTAFGSFLHFRDFILKAFEGFEHAFMDNDIIT